jgi:4-amino-4-deoxy-L-arabinose transferase-like glycosyltransferase
MSEGLSRLACMDELRLILLFIVVHTLAWTVAATLARSSGTLWDDMLETYAWAQEWQLGYYKHPPFYSWVVGVWFHVLPRTDWAYYLLSAVNVGVGFAGIWALAGRFMKVEARLLSVLLLTFMPYYNYMASNFNANTILLSLWPWTAYAFVRSMETRALPAAVAFGVLAAAGMLSKYYSVLLLASCFAASLAHPDARRYYRSAAPYVTVAVAALLLVPHVWWAITNDLPPVKYALGKTGQPWLFNFQKGVSTAIASVAINSVAAAILIVALRWRRSAIFSGLRTKLVAHDHWWILILATGPFVLTILLGILGYIKVAVNFLIPTFFMWPLVIMLALEPAITRAAVRGVLRAVTLFLAGAVLLSPLIAILSFQAQFKDTSDVNDVAARDAARLWHETFDKPVRVVTGSEKYSIAQPFYGPDSPSEFTHFNFEQAPWLDRARIEREGLLVICRADEKYCLEAARPYAHEGTREIKVTIQRTFAGIAGPRHDLVYFMTPPRSR